MDKERYTIEHFGEFDDVESFIYDNETQRRILNSYNYGYNDLMEMLDFFNSQDRKIKELEKALENAIVPKFKKGQKVYYINSLNEISSGIIHNIRYDSAKGFDYFIPFLRIEDFRIKEEQLFETEEQAQKELKNDE